ncbi:MAG: cation:proton antiporter, partial [Lentisphaerae bacterium]|nr:cation:proton antiporter [Lentisphaerota bacterium]
MFANPVQDPVLVFALVMLVILVAPIFFARLRLPASVGLIISGMLLGPYALNVLARDDVMIMLGAVGLLYIMFLAGLEIDLNQFIRHRYHSLAFGVLTFLLPLVLGVGAGIFLLNMDWRAALLMASMFSSHTLISYPAVSNIGLNKNRAVTTTIGGTMITDTAALLVLAMVAGSVRGDLDAVFWLSMAGFLAGYVLLMLLILPLAARWFFKNMATDGIVDFVFVMAAVFLCSWLAHVARLEPILGAFLAGLAFNRLVPEQSVLMNRVQFIGKAFFIPFFLISVGMLIDLHILTTSSRMWLFAGVMVVTAILTKWLAARTIQRLLHYTSDEGGLIYGLSVNQAAATLAAALVGFEIGLFNDEVLVGTVVMILVTCTAGPWYTEKYARRVALAEKDTPYDPASAPHRVVVSLNNPTTAEALMDLAFLLRPPHSHEPVYAVTVTADGPDAEARVADGEKILEYAVLRAVAAEIPVVPMTRVDTSVINGVLGALRDLRGSNLVLGWNGEVSGRNRVFGSVIDGTVRMSRQMVLVTRLLQPLNICKRLVVVLPPLIERQPGFEETMRAVKLMAQRLGARVLVVTSIGVPEGFDRKLAELRPVVPMGFEPLAQTADLPATLKRRRLEGDVFALLQVRRGRLAWQPALDRLPGRVVQELPDVDLLSIYLPEMRWMEQDDQDTPTDQWRMLRDIPPAQARFDLDGMELLPALHALLSAAFAQRPDVMAAVARRLSVIAAQPVELAAGMVLLHTHLEGIAGPLFFLGVNRQGFVLQ